MYYFKIFIILNVSLNNPCYLFDICKYKSSIKSPVCELVFYRRNRKMQLIHIRSKLSAWRVRIFEYQVARHRHMRFGVFAWAYHARLVEEWTG